MDNLLVVPMRTSALQVKTTDNQTVSPLADFSRMPWSNGHKDINPGQPFLSENITTQPFTSGQQQLEAGTYLHWELPQVVAGASEFPILFFGLFVDFFAPIQKGWTAQQLWTDCITADWLESIDAQPNVSARILPVGDRKPLPAVYANELQAIQEYFQSFSQRAYAPVPDRWLIIRKGGGLAEKSWIVESDYLSVTKTADAPVSVPVPLPNGSVEQPYRFMGRTLEVGAPYITPTQDQQWTTYYNQPLTAAGFGDLNFSTFFPNCQGIFSFYDEEAIAPLNLGISYDIIGWYADSDYD